MVAFQWSPPRCLCFNAFARLRGHDDIVLVEEILERVVCLCFKFLTQLLLMRIQMSVAFMFRRLALVVAKFEAMLFNRLHKYLNTRYVA